MLHPIPFFCLKAAHFLKAKCILIGRIYVIGRRGSPTLTAKPPDRSILLSHSQRSLRGHAQQKVNLLSKRKSPEAVTSPWGKLLIGSGLLSDQTATF